MMKNLKLAKTTLLFTSLISGGVLASTQADSYKLSPQNAMDPNKVSEAVSFIGFNTHQALNIAIDAGNKSSENQLKVNELTKKLENFDEKVLEGKASQAELDQTNLKLEKKADQSALDAANTQITKNQQALNETKAELANKVSTQELGKKADQSALDAANAKITKNQQVLNETKAELANKVSTQELAKKADKSALDAANLMIQRNQQAIALLAPANTTKLHEQVQSNTARLNKLDKELQRGVATQAALSGLFQPYNVGKVNLTAAVGGYKSKSAVAVGMGYRVNEKFAAKVGAAISVGDRNSAAYNVGVNYEF